MRFGVARRLGDAGRFRLLHLLGEDAIGAVWRARDDFGGSSSTIRVVRPPLGTDPGFVERLHVEVADLLRPGSVNGTLAARLDHPNAIRPLSVHAGDETHPSFVVMEPVQGRMLLDVLGQSKVVDVPEAIWITAQLAHVVQSAHEAGIVHGLIHPGSVFCSPWGRAVLIDFGLMRALGSMDKTDHIFRSLAPYRSPQEDATALTPASDVYSLGALLFAMLSGRAAVEGATEAMERRDPPNGHRPAADRAGRGRRAAGPAHDGLVPAESWSIPSEVPDQVARMCREALAPDPHARPSAAAFRSALTPFLILPEEERSAAGLRSE